MLSTLTSSLLAAAPMAWTLLAQADEETPRRYALETAIVLLCLVLGLLVTLRPTKRTDEVDKRPEE